MKSNRKEGRLSIIIPVLNEEEYIGSLLDYLFSQSSESNT